MGGVSEGLVINVTCGSCKTEFPVSVPGSESWMSLADGAAVQQQVGYACPSCGETGSMQVGATLAATVRDAVAALSGLNSAQLGALRDILDEAHQSGATSEDVRQAVEEAVPDATRIGGLLGNGAMPLATWLAVLLQAIALLLAYMALRQAGEPAQLTDSDVQEIAQKVVEEVAVNPGDAPRARPGAVGRNDPCPCGRGVKYKRCHGR